MGLDYFEKNVIYSRDEEDRKIANNLFACENCYNYLTAKEQHVCDSD